MEPVALLVAAALAAAAAIGCAVVRTRDGVEVRLTVSVLWTVTDPALIVRANPTAATATAAAVERALHHLVAGVELGELLREREAVLARVPETARRVVAVFGVDLVDVDLLDAQVRLGPQLLRLLA
ncbi:SPFH domain-containing protein [Jiangella muralis]|uniref:SPFH domain-containing protein n=1 Tax=Jiangella muralis TaxID=702383 RepID=UPI00069DF069|nr:SPFH domain-containing protein [Jiangella muralis]